ncbi:MAG: MBL fold metallo-hydrolase [Polyangiales bacterium]
MTTDLEPRTRPSDPTLPKAIKPYFESPRTPSGFANPWEHAPVPSLGDVLRWKTQRNTVRPAGYRARPLEAVPDALAAFARSEGAPTRIFWIGHASFLAVLDEARFVIDPIFGRAGGLVGRVTPPAALPTQLTGLSAVLVTHGHHDHLDPSALRALALANGQDLPVIVPAGLGRFVPRGAGKVVELAWWQHVTIDGVRVHLVPAQHWHRRGLADQNKSLWGGYVLEGTHRVYHSGDTGYFGGFRAIGHAFGGIDAACLPLGAYEPRWFMGTQHMSPEQSLDALTDLDATHFVGMHWGAYDLSDEPMEAGPVIVRDEAAARGLDPARLHVIRPGGSVRLDGARGATRATDDYPYQLP